MFKIGVLFFKQEHYQSYEIFELPVGEVVCVYAESDYGFVGVDHTGFKCYTCNFNTHSCCHIEFLKEKINCDDVDLPDFVYEMYHLTLRKKKLEWKPCCVTKNAIQFQPPLHIQHILGSSFYESMAQDDGTLVVIPHISGVCGSCGSPWSLLNPVTEMWKDESLLLYAMNKIYQCTSMCFLFLY